MLQEDENIALQRVREAEGLFFPKLDVNANWSKFRVEGDKPLLLQPAMGPTLITSSPRENFYTARANIYQTVYEGGRTKNVWKQARISYERARSADDAVRIQVTQSASLEGIRMEKEFSALRDEAAQVGLAEEQTRLAYLQALNLELNTNVLLKGELATQPVALDLQKLLAWASQYRAELRQTEYQEELDALGISLSLAERTPTIGFGASYERTGHDVNLHEEDWAGTLNINVPLSFSNLFFGWAKVREHKAQYRQATLKHAEAQDQIQLQVRQAYTKYRFWQSELVPREMEYHRAQTVTDALRAKGGNGLEWLEAERLLLDAHLRYQKAVHGHLIALAELERAVGHSLTPELS